MKVLKVLTALAMVGLATSLTYADDAPPAPGQGQHAPGGMMEKLLPPHLLTDLNLTPEQKTQYDALETSFKTDAKAWDAAHPNFTEEMHKVRESGDRDAGRTLMEQRRPLMEARKGYVDKLRATLTDDQKATLDKARDAARSHMRGGQHSNTSTNAPKATPPPPPAD